jgi:hypothetical protein
MVSAGTNRGGTLLPASAPRQFHLLAKPTGAVCNLGCTCRAPSELVRRYAAGDSRRGRNDPCPCGSGRKWKRFHQLPPAAG